MKQWAVNAAVVLIMLGVIGALCLVNAEELKPQDKPQVTQVGVLPGTWLVTLKNGMMYESQIRQVPIGVFILGVNGDKFISKKHIKSIKQVTDGSENGTATGGNLLRHP